MVELNIQRRIGSSVIVPPALNAAGAAPSHARVHAGDWVEVRSKEEILATLDERGRLDGLPFMPQMFQYCGLRFKVFKSAHKTCDTASGVYRGRLLPGGVHLDLRCDGKAYGGCQAGCLIFWKQAWLKPIDASTNTTEPAAVQHASRLAGARVHPPCSEQNILAGTRHPEAGAEPRFSCQATDIVAYTKPLEWWDARQYTEDIRTSNVSIRRMAGVFTYATYVFWTRANSQRWGAPGRWLYDQFQSVLGGQMFPRYRGTIQAGRPTPKEDLGLKAGDWVRVKTYDQILATLNTAGANRNMNFDAELVPYCGKIFKVRTQVETFIDETNGKLKTMKTPAVILDGVYCKASYSHDRLLCPRGIFSWWREGWLERVTASGGQALDDGRETTRPSCSA
jgi:hypothetical protein